MPNSGMAIHRLVLISDSFSCNCNSIQSPVSIVHLRVILTYLIPLLRVYINYSISNAYSVFNLYSNVTTSTRINILQCTYVHLRLFHSKLHSTLRVSSIRIYILIDGFVDPKCNTYFLKETANKLAIPLNIIFNKSLESSDIPDE